MRPSRYIVGAASGEPMKKCAAIVILFSAMACVAQTDNTFYVKQFPGVTVGQKVTAAMQSCNVNAIIPCILVLDPSLAAYAQGTMPTLCSQCSLVDYRNGNPIALPSSAPLIGTNALGAAQIINPYAPNPIVPPATAVTVNVPGAQIATSGWAGAWFYGNSIPQGTGATSCPSTGLVKGTAGYCWPDILATDIGLTSVTNNAVAGATVCDTANVVFNTANPDVNQNILYAEMSLTNDVIHGGIGSYESTAQLCHQAILSYLATEASLRVTGASFAPGTNWSLDTTYSAITGHQSSTQGASEVWTYTTTVPGQEVFVHYRIFNGGGGYWQGTDTGSSTTYYVDSYPTGVGIYTGNGATYSMGVLALINPTRAVGTYNFTVTVDSATGAGNNNSILDVVPAPPTANGAPIVQSYGTPRQLSENLTTEANAQASSKYNSDGAMDVQFLQSLGLTNLSFVDERNCLMGTPSDMATGIVSAGLILHPTPTGHLNTANCGLGQTALRPYPVQGAIFDPSAWNTTTWTNFQTNATYYLSPYEQVASFVGTAAGTVVLPYVSFGKFIVINNEMSSTSGLNITLAAQTGINTGGAVGTVIPPGQSVLVQTTHGSSGTQYNIVGIGPTDNTQYNSTSSLSSATTLNCSQQWIAVNSSTTFAITLPNASPFCKTGKSFDFVNTGTAPVTLTGAGAGNASAYPIYPGTFMQVTQLGTSGNWYAGNIIGPHGYGSLVAGTLTVSTPAACALSSASCTYTFTNCGVAGTAGALYTLGTVTAGTSFVINSVSTTGTVVTTDTSKVCWRIN